MWSDNRRQDWMSRIAQLEALYPSVEPDANDGLHPVNILKALRATAPEDAIITTDVGQHQMWVAQAYPFCYPRSLLTSGGLGTMGFGLPAAIGAALANPGRRIICVSGDGSFQMNIQEMATLAELNLPVVSDLFNNGHLGLVRQQQEMFYERELYRLEVRLETRFFGDRQRVRDQGVPDQRGVLSS